MNHDQMRIAIAEACGLTLKKEWYGYSAYKDGMSVMFPNYLNDLNAMRDAELSLDDTVDMQDSDLVRYIGNLATICDLKPMALATASQRAEAFLKTIGKWKD